MVLNEFEAFLIVDWSARAKPAPRRPTKDAIWYCLRTPKEERVQYCRTRPQAEAEIRDILTRTPGRILAGFDFSFTFPLWAMERLGGWRALWQHLEAAERQHPNRFEIAADLNRRLHPHAPFWGCPKNIHCVPSRKSALLMPELRATDLALPRRPQSVFKLFTTGSVGSQTLTGIPVLERLRTHFAGELSVWPFEPPARIVVAEVWPSLEAELPLHSIKDARQVMSLARAFERCTLPQVPITALQEGWVLQPR